jgi:hypothetical protein
MHRQILMMLRMLARRRSIADAAGGMLASPADAAQ